MSEIPVFINRCGLRTIHKPCACEHCRGFRYADEPDTLEARKRIKEMMDRLEVKMLAREPLIRFSIHNLVCNEIDNPTQVERAEGKRGWMEDKSFWKARCIVKAIADRLELDGFKIVHKDDIAQGEIKG